MVPLVHLSHIHARSSLHEAGHNCRTRFLAVLEVCGGGGVFFFSWPHGPCSSGAPKVELLGFTGEDKEFLPPGGLEESGFPPKPPRVNRRPTKT